MTNYVKFPLFHFFEKVNKRELKMKNINYYKLTVLVYYHYIKIIKKPGTSFQSPVLSPKHVRNVSDKKKQCLANFHVDST